MHERQFRVYTLSCGRCSVREVALGVRRVRGHESAEERALERELVAREGIGAEHGAEVSDENNVIP